MIDIVVTYLNERDKEWRESFKYWKEREIEEKRAEEDNRQAFGEERTREWDSFKYWFRGIEKNCKWVNKVYVIVQNEKHVPEWLDIKNERIKVVYHEEYIPKELLPTYNAMTIGMYVSNIEGLSEKYIMSDDDYYFLNEIEEERFFKGEKAVHLDNEVEYKKYGKVYLKGSDRVFYEIMNNNLEFEEKVTGKRIKYRFYHLPEARIKSFEREILKKYGEEIKNRNKVSKFRNKENLCSYVFSDLLKIENKAVMGNPYINCNYCTLRSDVNFNEYWDKDIVCFNDTENLDNYEKTKEKLIEFLEKKFPDKSSFEK